MFRGLLPHCYAALPAAAAVTLAAPGVVKPLRLTAHDKSKQAALAPPPSRYLACEVAGTGRQIRALQAKAAGGMDAFEREYELGDELGRGTFGVVQCVRHKATGQLRAVKRMQQLRGGSAALEEAQVLASLDHPNVVAFHECFRSGEEFVLVQELCEGIPLEEKLDSLLGAGLGARDAAVALQQMLLAVQHCHERGFVHRDLKADNFVFASPAPAAQLKLVDFGLADRCGRDERLPGRAGTVDYSSPEALQQGFGQPADVWALGALFFLLMTGEPLINVGQSAPSTSEEMRRALEGKIIRRVMSARYIRARLAAAAPDLPETALDLLEEMLCPDPYTRITAERALQHPFIVEHVSSLPATSVE